MAHPQLLHTVLDAVDVRHEAEFRRELLGLVYRAGDEVPEGPGAIDDLDWLVLTVPGVEELAEQHTRVLGLGATVLLDRSDDEDEPLYVYADQEGHPFCLFVA